MYQSLITIFEREFENHVIDGVYKAVKGYAVDVNKEELLKALQYDREQYEKGYKDGYAKAIEEFAEAVKERAYSKEYDEWNADYMISIWESVIDEIAKELKGE